MRSTVDYPLTIGIIIAFVCLWLLGSLIFSYYIDRWTELVPFYKTKRKFPRRTKYGCSASMGRLLGRFRGVMIFGADAQGFYAGLLPPWAPFHPRLFIPWSDIVIESSAGEFPNLTTFWLGASRVPLTIDGKLAKKLLALRTETPAEQ